MNDEPELEINSLDPEPDDAAYLARRKGKRPRSGKLVPVLAGVAAVLIFGGGILYFFTRPPAGGEPNPVESKMAALEQRIAGLEKQLSELQERAGAAADDNALLQRLDTLTQKVDTLERDKRWAAAPAQKASSPARHSVSADKQYHTVRRKETIQQISRRYRVSVNQLRRLNNLSDEQRLRTGQKLVVSAGR